MGIAVSFKAHWENESTYFCCVETYVSFKANQKNVKMNICLFNN